MAKATCVGVLLALLVVAMVEVQAASTFAITTYTAEMSNVQVTPMTGPEGRYGTAVCLYDRNASPPLLDCEVQHNVDSVAYGPLTASIRRGAPGATGEVLYSFDEPVFFNARQLFQLEPKALSNGFEYGLFLQEEDFLNGRWYIEVTSNFFPFGEVRGNFGHTHNFFSRLHGDFVLPVPVSTQASGVALGTFTISNPRRTLVMKIAHSVENPTEVTINRGNRNEDGPIEYVFENFTSPIRESIQYTMDKQKDLFLEEEFLQIVSADTSLSEVRGQIIPIDYAAPASYTARLDGSQLRPAVATAARGCAIVTYNCETSSIEYLIFHSVQFPTTADVRISDTNNFNGVGEGEIVFQLPRAKSPIFGVKKLDPKTFNALVQNRLAFNIRSSNHPNGEIRGGVTNYKFPYYAYLSGTSITPKRTTSAVGCATFRTMEELSDGTTVLDYDIQHDVFDPLGVDLFVGTEDTEGVFNRQFARTLSPISGVNEHLDPKTLNEFQVGRTFLQVRSSRFYDDVAGELRGQIYKVLDIPCPAPLPPSTIDVLSTLADPPPDWALPPLESQASTSFVVSFIALFSGLFLTLFC